MRSRVTVVVVCACLALTGCAASATPRAPRTAPSAAQVVDHSSPAARRLAAAAASQVGKTVSYDASYTELRYPGGDVPIERGVCTDVVIRAFRSLGVDLQVEVHKDMAAHFAAYPHRWGLAGPDTNIDHRRVPNLETYFSRQEQAVPASDDAADYWPGDLVTWDLYGRPHIGIVSTVRSADGSRFCIVHNIGAGTQIEDRLFDFKITGHYRPF